MSGQRATPIFVDTSAFYAYFVDNAPRHDRSRAVMNAIQTGDLRFRPIYTSGYVLSELTTLILRKATHGTAVDTLRSVRESDAITVLHPNDGQFETVCDSFEQFDDQQISFVDHTTATLADTVGATHIFAFDSDFRTLGFSLVPEDITLPGD